MSDFDHIIPTENDNSNQVDEQPVAYDVAAQMSVLIHIVRKIFTRDSTNIGATMAHL